MKRFLPLLTLTGLLFGQDVLHLKSGESYKGTFYGKVGEDIVFKVEGETSTKKFSINDVETIVTKNGELSYPFDVPKIANDAKKNSLTLEEEEYQKLSINEKAIYDANLYNLKHWALYGSISTIIFSGNNLFRSLTGKYFISKGSLAASLTISYFVLNREENLYKSMGSFYFLTYMTDSEKEFYEQAYSKRLKERKIKYIVRSVAVTGILCYVILGAAFSDFSLDFGSSSTAHSTAW